MHRCAAASALSLCLTTISQAANPTFERVVDIARTSADIPPDMVEAASANCDTALCFAKVLASALPDRVRLEPVDHPDTDSIRRATTTPSIATEKTGDTLKLELTHFGRKSVAELREMLASTRENIALELDLAGNEGGDFERMLAIAGLLLGPRPDVIEIDYGDRIEHRSLKGPSVPAWHIVSVETDERTASAALLLAHLIEAHADANVSGPKPVDQRIFLKQRITVDHDWRLILPVAELRAGSLERKGDAMTANEKNLGDP